jgi:hypothetical protein
MNYRRLCLANWTGRNESGLICKLIQGQDYVTEGPFEDEEGEWMRVFNGYPFRVLAAIFDLKAITKAPGSKRPVQPVNDEFIEQLRAMPRYRHVDLIAALRKCSLWACSGRIPTRHRFLQYLNKNHASKNSGKIEEVLP